MINLKETNVATLAHQFRSRQLDLNDLYDDLIEQIKFVDEEVMAFEAFDEDVIRERVEYLKSQQKAFINKDICFGIPYGVKDVINTCQLTTERGSIYWKGYTAGNNARVVDRLEYYGGVMMGKTVTAELAVHHPGRTKNPYNFEHSPGTSSMGSAVSVACGMTMMALGTQTGSSIIRPASYTGVFGFKPSYAVFPRTGVLKTTDTLDHVGFFVNSIDDARLFFDLLRVNGPNYPISDRLLGERAHFRNIIKIGVLRPQYLWANYQGYVVEQFEKVVDGLRNEKTVKIVDIEDDGFFSDSHRIHSILYDKSLHYYFKKESENKDVISETLYKMVSHGAEITFQEFHQALAQQERMQCAFDADFQNFDIIITPSTANYAPKIDPYHETDDTGLIWSLLGTPALNVPLFTHRNLPFGLLVTGVKYSDYRLLDIVRKLLDLDCFLARACLVSGDMNVVLKGC